MLATGVGLITEFDLKVNMISWICFYTRYPNIRLHDGDFEPEVGRLARSNTSEEGLSLGKIGLDIFLRVDIIPSKAKSSSKRGKNPRSQRG